MNITCMDRARIFLDGTPEEWAALEVHAATCAGCCEEVRAWKNLSVTASEMHQEWDSAALWPRIEEALRQQPPVSNDNWFHRIFGGWNLRPVQWQVAAAALLMLTLTGSAIWFLAHPRGGKIPPNVALLNDSTVHEVEHAEAAYERAIDKLDAQARPQLQNSPSPLMANYREKLLVLDSAIADLKSQAGINPANGHLRRQLLAMYQEKQDTLEQILEAQK
jgi:hypothetical protein